MNNTATTSESLFDKVGNFSKSTIKLFLLTAIDKSADVVSSLLSRLAVIMVVAVCILVFNIGIALWIGDLLGKSHYGFFVIGGVYSIISILLYKYRHQWIKYPISNAIINQMRKQKVI